MFWCGISLFCTHKQLLLLDVDFCILALYIQGICFLMSSPWDRSIAVEALIRLLPASSNNCCSFPDSETVYSPELAHWV
jgi:hypothetical protein